MLLWVCCRCCATCTHLLWRGCCRAGATDTAAWRRHMGTTTHRVLHPAGHAADDKPAKSLDEGDIALLKSYVRRLPCRVDVRTLSIAPALT